MIISMLIGKCCVGLVEKIAFFGCFERKKVENLSQAHACFTQPFSCSITVHDKIIEQTYTTLNADSNRSRAGPGTHRTAHAVFGASKGIAT